VAGAAASPHVTAHSELPVHVALQSPSHLMVHAVESEQAIVLSSPTWILQVALMLQTAFAPSPSLKSQFELAVHVTSLSSPPKPLHCDESAHVNVRVPSVLPSHFAELVHASEQSESPQAVLQSAPAVQVHAVRCRHRHRLRAPTRFQRDPPPKPFAWLDRISVHARDGPGTGNFVDRV
jgi:hypothetical protein